MIHTYIKTHRYIHKQIGDRFIARYIDMVVLFATDFSLTKLENVVNFSL